MSFAKKKIKVNNISIIMRTQIFWFVYNTKNHRTNLTNHNKANQSHKGKEKESKNN